MPVQNIWTNFRGVTNSIIDYIKANITREPDFIILHVDPNNLMNHFEAIS